MSMAINALLFAGLTAHNEKNEVVPGLAEDWASTKNLHLFHRMQAHLP